MIESLIELVIASAMFGVMFSMGLTLTLGDFRRVAATPKATVIGTVLQLVVMPIVAIGLARAFELPPILTAGLVVVGACPGGMFSNVFVHLAQAHTALSVTLTATATTITLFTLPIWVRLALAAHDEGGLAIEMPVLETALRLGGLTVLPVAIGMIARVRLPVLLPYERRLAGLSGLFVVVGSLAQGAFRPDFPADQFLQSFPPAISFAFSAIVLGTIVPALFRLPSREVVTIGVEVIVKNTLLGIVIVSSALDFEAMLPIFAFATVQTPIGAVLLFGWRWLARRGVVTMEPPSHERELRPELAGR